MSRHRSAPARVHWVIDGDSLEVAMGREIFEVRLFGIDAPELAQPYGPESGDALRRMLGRQTFWLEEQDVDQYGRIVALLYHRDRNCRSSVNLRMVREGYAYAFTRYGGAELGFHQAEADARQGRRGVWRESRRGGERPWDYRRYNRQMAARRGGPCGLIAVGLAALVVIIVLVGTWLGG